jgi:hypothetical protein
MLLCNVGKLSTDNSFFCSGRQNCMATAVGTTDFRIAFAGSWYYCWQYIFSCSTYAVIISITLHVPALSECKHTCLLSPLCISVADPDLFLAIHRSKSMLKTDCRQENAACMDSHCEMGAQRQKCNASYEATSEGSKSECSRYRATTW